MSDMNGNLGYAEAQRIIIADHEWNGVGYETADAQHIVGHIEANTQVTLALAYEQRTANLIATLQVGAVDMTDWPQQVIDNFHRTSIEVSQRMGIEGATK